MNGFNAIRNARTGINYRQSDILTLCNGGSVAAIAQVS
jgi:hypothetical protein